MAAETTGHEIVLPPPAGPGGPGLCETGPDPISLPALLLELLRGHFSDPAKILYPQLDTRIWAADVATTKIAIESALRWDPAKAGSLPAVLLVRGDFSEIPVSIDGYRGTDLEGKQHFSAIMGGTLIARCLSTQQGEAELLGAEVFRTLRHFTRAIREAAGLLRFRPNGATQVKKYRKDGDRWRVDIPIQVIWDDSFTIAPVLEPFDSYEILLTFQVDDRELPES